MPIVVPTEGSEIDVATFGKPVVDEVNRLSGISNHPVEFWVPQLSSAAVGVTEVMISQQVIPAVAYRRIIVANAFALFWWQFNATEQFQLRYVSPANLNGAMVRSMQGTTMTLSGMTESLAANTAGTFTLYASRVEGVGNQQVASGYFSLIGFPTA